MARANLYIKVGTYTGTGAAQVITAPGFPAQFVLIKGGANAPVFRTKQMRLDSTALTSAAANATNNITALTTTGFAVGTDARVNANGTVYYYVAIAGNAAQAYFRTGLYRGSGGDNRDYTHGGLGFTPSLVLLKGDAAQSPNWKSSSISGDATSYFGSTTNQTNRIQSLISGGFQLGSNAEANGSGTEYFFMAMKALSRAFVVGSYTGNGVDGRTISGLGFAPDAVFVKGNTAQNSMLKTTDMGSNVAFPLAAATSNTTSITALGSDGFTLGTNATTNSDGVTYYYCAWKSGSFVTPLSRNAV